MPEFSDTEAFLDPDASREYLRSWKANAEATAARAQAMAEQLGRLRVTAKDDNGLAEVTIDSSGVLLDLELTERIHRYAPDAVARAVMSALRAARQTAARRAQDIAVEAMGPDSLSARTIADRMREQLERPEAGAEPGERG
ncbi:YbaB/EbfC family nucleoid-associated protein [Actinoplanes subtropicus]|uniref:YbaB/EbfC family nucleoid-associated protein n=1 Tax=Actinoplanes subtropicus TaxID=543632 RepID=UPI0004C2EE99|nr:YbaB/EbfC family nucleoid-associated protein [Actinoplanes subtropicus]